MNNLKVSPQFDLTKWLSEMKPIIAKIADNGRDASIDDTIDIKELGEDCFFAITAKLTVESVNKASRDECPCYEQTFEIDHCEPIFWINGSFIALSLEQEIIVMSKINV